MNKNFSYVSIIATIFLLGLLIWMVYPRTEVVQKEITRDAKVIQEKIDTSSIQNAISLYFIQNEQLPTSNPVEVGVPQKIDFSKLVTDFIKKEPMKSENYWIDSNAKVSYCPFDANNYAELQASNSLLAWSLVQGVHKYNIYDLNSQNEEYALLGYSNSNSNYFKLTNINPSAIYAVSMVDSAGNECPAVKAYQ